MTAPWSFKVKQQKIVKMRKKNSFYLQGLILTLFYIHFFPWTRKKDGAKRFCDKSIN